MFLSCHVCVFRVNSHPIVSWITRNTLFETGAISEVWVTAKGLKQTNKYSQHSSIIWPIRLNGSVFIYELSSCRLQSLKPQILHLFQAKISLTFRQLCDLQHVCNLIRTNILVSILPLLSKVYERVMYKQASNYSEPFYNEVLCGFRKTHSM